ncbi:MAG: ABC transporter ATP-binding protein [Acidobacteria bacterium]|nr:ABC transporter ATP-binding protein [Acidobacteriota bacterium]
MVTPTTSPHVVPTFAALTVKGARVVVVVVLVVVVEVVLVVVEIGGEVGGVAGDAADVVDCGGRLVAASEGTDVPADPVVHAASSNAVPHPSAQRFTSGIVNAFASAAVELATPWRVSGPGTLVAMNNKETAGLRSSAARPGVGLLVSTLFRYRREATKSILGALLWMIMIVAMPLLTRAAIDEIGRNGASVAGLYPIIGWFVAAGLLQSVGIGLRRYYGFLYSYRAEADLRNRLFEHMQRLTFGFHDVTSPGELMARASSDLSQVRLIFAMAPITIANLGMFVVVGAVLLWIDLILGLASIAMIPLLFVFVTKYSRRVLPLSAQLQERHAGYSQVVEEAVSGIQVVKAYGQEAQEQARLEAAAADIKESSLSIAKYASVYAPVLEVIPSAARIVVVWLGGTRLVNGAISFGDFVAFLQYLGVLIMPIRITGWFFANLPRGAVAATRVRNLLETEPEILAPRNPQRLPDGPGRIEFKNVSFTYPDGPAILHNVDVVIRGGESVALVGATGSGKTTLAHLIPRFHDVAEGAVSIDGVDVRSLSLDDLRRETAIVFQDTYLFSASIRDNIALGAPGASDDSVRAAARLARAHEFICEMPDSYDTVVGERGHSLSGGQRQRVALARAVLRDPRVLILDDATSSIDAIVEAEIQAALRRVMQGRTTVIIAHRTSTLALVDRVLFLEEGRIVASGTHDELMATIPRYAEVLAAEDAAGNARVGIR